MHKKWSSIMETKNEIVMVEAIVISYDELKTLVNLKQKESYQVTLTEIIENKDLSPLEKLEQMKKAETSTLSKVSEIIGGLEKYYYYNDGKDSYLVEMPVVASNNAKTAAASQKDKNFVIPFQSGDFIRLEHDGKVSQTYTYTLAGLIDEQGQPIKASKAVEQFMFGILGKERLPNFKGFPGFSHPYWKVVEPVESEAKEETKETETTNN